MIVGLGHKARVGKDTAAKYLVENHDFTRLAFADVLKAMALDIDPMIGPDVSLAELVARDGWEEAKKLHQVRRFLQNLGVAARVHLGPDVWVRPVLEEIERYPERDFVVTDVRFQNEFIALDEMGAKLVRIMRPEVESNAGDHVSEIELANAPWHYSIINDKTFEDLELRLRAVLGLRKAA